MGKQVDLTKLRSVSQIVSRIDYFSKEIIQQDLDHLNQLIATITSDQNEFASVDVFDLFSKEPIQLLFVDKLYLFRLRKDAGLIEMPRGKFEILLISFKCILESSHF